MNLFYSRGKMTIKILKKFTLFLLFTISILGVINADEAIETSNQSGASNTFSIEEIIVTAEKRSESLQDVSKSVTALSSDELEAKNIIDFVGLSAITPGLTVAKNEGYKTVISIRGVGDETNQNAIAAPSVALHMDGIFVDSPSARRRFLDRLVIAFDPAHIGRMARYEKALRQRAYLLSEGQADAGWLQSLEAVLAETAVAVTAARQTLIRDLNQEAEKGWLGFPGVRLGLVGDTEQWLAEMPALQVEDKLMAAAKTARLAGDAAMPGPHASDVQAVHLASQTPAYLASTGQQKALLIAVVLAHARLQERRLGKSPLMLLDDVAAHLDADRRSALFEAVGLLGGQCWYSGSDEQQFDDLTGKAQFVSVRPASRSDQTPEFEVK